LGSRTGGTSSLMSFLQRPIVLLVEDSEDDAFFFRHTLKKAGLPCSLFHVADGGDALRYLEAAQAAPDNATQPLPDLVFLDLKLPTFSGFEILAWIGERKLETVLDITVLSGSEHTSDVDRAMKLGARAYVAKPISIEQLRARFLSHANKSAAAGATETGAVPASV
jgi:DNA-binding response OmpR family regulator